MTFAWPEQAYIRELQGEQAIERGQITAEIVRHHQRGSLAVRLEIIREFGSVREVMNDPTKRLRELPHGRDLGAGAEEDEPHQQRHMVEKGAGALRDQFRGCQQRGAERFAFVASAEAAGLPALEPGAEFGEEIAPRAGGSHALHQDAQLPVAAIETAHVERQQNRRRAADDLPPAPGDFNFQAASAQDADGAAIGISQHPGAGLAISGTVRLHQRRQRPRLVAVFADALDDLPQSFHCG